MKSWGYFYEELKKDVEEKEFVGIKVMFINGESDFLYAVMRLVAEGYKLYHEDFDPFENHFFLGVLNSSKKRLEEWHNKHDIALE